MNDNLDPQAYLDRIASRLEAAIYGPRRRYTPAQIEQVIRQVPPFARAIFEDVRDGLSYRRIALRRWITVRRVEREYATALFLIARGLRMIDHQG
jgi:hypothetical protein